MIVAQTLGECISAEHKDVHRKACLVAIPILETGKHSTVQWVDPGMLGGPHALLALENFCTSSTLQKGKCTGSLGFQVVAEGKDGRALSSSTSSWRRTSVPG